MLPIKHENVHESHANGNSSLGYLIGMFKNIKYDTDFAGNYLA